MISEANSEMTYRNHPLPFPSRLPDGYRYRAESISFDPNTHLQLEMPTTCVTLDELGYSQAQIGDCPTDFAVSTAVRILSDEGVEVMREISRHLKQYSVNCERIENMVRGGVYQSEFLRDFCLCPEVTEFIGEVFKTPVAPHTMPLHLGHLNFAPDDLSRAVDLWHHDTLALDYVLMLSDPGELQGGDFQYFNGTRDEAKEYADSGVPIPDDRTVTPHFPGSGYAIVLHGNMVVHRATKLTKAAERITLVNGYVPLAADVEDACRFPDLTLVDPHHVLFTEWARHKAWLAIGKLNEMTADIPFTDDREVITSYLKCAIADVETAIGDLENIDDASMIHYGE